MKMRWKKSIKKKKVAHLQQKTENSLLIFNDKQEDCL